MARIRTIKPQFFTSEDVTALEPLARLLFVGLFTECDRDGRVEDRPRTLKMRLLPEDDCDVDALLWCLVDGGLIRRYEAGGVNVIQVSGFQRHQKPHPKEPASTLPDKGTDRPKPCKKTASREKVVMVPVENPSSPVGREGKEYGVSLREGKGTETRPPTLIARGEGVTWFKRHGAHVEGFCDWVCLDEQQCSEFAAKVPGDDHALKVKQVNEWALDIRRQWSDRIIPDGSHFEFWRNRWTETHGGSRPANATLKAAQAAKSIDEAFR
jgi:hypothetical protein